MTNLNIENRANAFVKSMEVFRNKESSIVVYNKETSAYGIRSKFKHRLLKVAKPFVYIISKLQIKGPLKWINAKLEQEQAANEIVRDIQLCDEQNDSVNIFADNKSYHTVKEFTEVLNKIRKYNILDKSADSSKIFARTIKGHNPSYLQSKTGLNLASDSSDTFKHAVVTEAARAGQEVEQQKEKDNAIHQERVDELGKAETKEMQDDVTRQVIFEKVGASKAVQAESKDAHDKKGKDTIKQHIKYLFADKKSKDAEKNKKLAVEYFNSNRKLLQSEMLGKFFIAEVVTTISELNKEKKKFNIENLSIFQDHEIYPSLLEECAKNKINICKLFNKITFKDPIQWANHDSLKKIYNHIKTSGYQSEVIKNNFEKILKKLISANSKNIVAGHEDTILNLLYSGILDNEKLFSSLADKDISNILLLIMQKPQGTWIEDIKNIVEFCKSRKKLDYKDEALISAIMMNNPECMNALMEGGYNPNAKYQDFSILSLLLMQPIQGSEKIIIELAKRADPDILDLEKKTSLMHAISGKKYMNEILVRSKLLGAKDKDGDAALHYAIEHSAEDKFIKALIKRGADANATRKNGETPLMMATSKGNLVAVKALIESEKVDLEKVNNKKTVLHLAIESENSAIVKALLDAGADINKRDKDGNDAIQLADTIANTDIQEILKEHKSK